MKNVYLYRRNYCLKIRGSKRRLLNLKQFTSTASTTLLPTEFALILHSRCKTREQKVDGERIRYACVFSRFRIVSRPKVHIVSGCRSEKGKKKGREEGRNEDNREKKGEWRRKREDKPREEEKEKTEKETHACFANVLCGVNDDE